MFGFVAADLHVDFNHVSQTASDALVGTRFIPGVTSPESASEKGAVLANFLAILAVAIC